MDYILRVNPITGLYEQRPLEDSEPEIEQEISTEEPAPVKKPRGRPHGATRK